MSLHFATHNAMPERAPPRFVDHFNRMFRIPDSKISNKPRSQLAVTILPPQRLRGMTRHAPCLPVSSTGVEWKPC